jgi:hypothetical protein
MIHTLRACCAALFLAAASAQATPVAVYDNTSVDTFYSAFFSTGYTQLGDQVHLQAPSLLSSLDAQFFNAGDDAVFNATLSFYSVGPTPSLIGGSFTASGVSIAGGSSLTVGFGDLGNLAVPEDVLVLISVQLVSGAGDIGLNFFDAPSVGASDHGFFLANDGTGLAQASTLMDVDNLYLRIEGTLLATNDVPEPGTAALVLLPLGALAWRQRRSGPARNA